MQKRLKVLVSAYACESAKGSEPGVGWNWVKQIGRFHEVWVITRTSNRESIERGKSGIPSNIHWVYYDFPGWFRFWKKGQRGVHLYYYLWQIAVYFLARRMHKETNFDIVHHLTFGVYWLPSFLSLLPAAFIFGPLGGAERTPREFYRSYSLKGRIYERLRDAARWVGEKDPFVLLSIRRAKLVLAKVRETGERLSLLGAKEVQIYPESGISIEEIEKLPVTKPAESRNFKIISIGRLLHWKGFHLGLKAFSRLLSEFPSSEYWIIGQGPERENLELLAKTLGIADKVKFFSELPREDVLKKLSECDGMVHPSLHDSGGWVCLEAMAMGKPVLCLDLGGPAMQVTEETGFKLLADTPEQSVDDLANAMLSLANDSSLGERMGEAARKRVTEHFEWDKKGEWINKIYQELVI
ncbi:MAG: glycosyltransferase [Deltaproteobacteria bacterium]